MHVFVCTGVVLLPYCVEWRYSFEVMCIAWHVDSSCMVVTKYHIRECFNQYTVINTHTVFCILLKLYACKIDRCCAPFLEMSVVISSSHICQIHQQTYEQNQRASLRYAQKAYYWLKSTRYIHIRSFIINYSRPPNVSC